MMVSFRMTAQSRFSDAELLFTGQKFEKAKPLFLAYLNTHPNDLKTIEYLGDIAGHQKHWDQAIDYYTMLVTAEDSNANYHYKLGGALGMKSLAVSKFRALAIIDDVEFHFLKAATLDPNHIDARWALVELYVKLPAILGGTAKKALKYAEQLAQLSPVDGYLAKGFVYSNSNKLQLAEDNYLKALAVGGSVTCYQKLIDFYIENNFQDKAASVLKVGVDVHGRNSFPNQISRLKKQFD